VFLHALLNQPSESWRSATEIYRFGHQFGHQHDTRVGRWGEHADRRTAVMTRVSTSVSASCATRSVTPPTSISIGAWLVPVADAASLSDVTQPARTSPSGRRTRHPPPTGRPGLLAQAADRDVERLRVQPVLVAVILAALTTLPPRPNVLALELTPLAAALGHREPPRPASTPGEDGHRALHWERGLPHWSQNIRHAVAHALWIARVDQTASEPVGQADPHLDLAQHQQAAVRGHLAAVKTGDHPFAGDR
jgi:hypothetical protein